MTRVLYGVGQMAEGIKSDSFALFLLFYYREVLGLSGTLAGLALMISLVSDAVSDPLVGALSDRARTRWGRRHPFMAAAALPVAITYYLSFSPPAGLGQTGLFAWLVVFTVLARFALTLFIVPYMALGAELSEDYHERTRIVTLRTAFATLGRSLPGLLGFVVFMRPSEAFPNGQLNPDAYRPYALVTAVLILLPIVVSVVGTRGLIGSLVGSGPRADAHGLPDRRGRLLQGLAHDFVNCLRLPNFRVHFFGSTVAFTAWGLMGTLAIHLATYFWRVGTQGLVLWGMGMFSGLFAGLLFWTRAAATHEKRDVFVRGLALFILFTAPPVFLRTFGLWPADNSSAHMLLYVGTTGFLAHFGIAATMTTGGSMMADVADEDELAHGQRREGIFFGAVSFAAKAALGVGAQVAGLVLDLVGLVPGSDPDTVSTDVVRNLGLVLGITVIAVVGLSMRIYLTYDLTRARLTAVRAQLEGRR